MQPPPPPPGQPPQAPIGPPRPQLDLSGLPLADVITAASALLFTIFTGIGWYAVEYYGGGFVIEVGVARGKGTMGGLGLAVGIIVLLFAIVMIADHYFNFIPMELPVALIYLGAAALALLFLLLGLVVRPGGGPFDIVSWPMWIISLIFALGIGVGGFLKLQQTK
jgi:hypothetical protein